MGVICSAVIKRKNTGPFSQKLSIVNTMHIHAAEAAIDDRKWGRKNFKLFSPSITFPFFSGNIIFKPGNGFLLGTNISGSSSLKSENEFIFFSTIFLKM